MIGDYRFKSTSLNKANYTMDSNKRTGISLSVVPCTHSMDMTSKITIADTPIKELKTITTKDVGLQKIRFMQKISAQPFVMETQRRKQKNIFEKSYEKELKIQNQKLKEQISQIMRILTNERQSNIEKLKNMKQKMDFMVSQHNPEQSDKKHRLQVQKLAEANREIVKQNIQLYNKLHHKDLVISEYRNRNIQVSEKLKKKEEELKVCQSIVEKLKQQDQVLKVKRIQTARSTSTMEPKKRSESKRDITSVILENKTLAAKTGINLHLPNRRS